MEIIAINGSPRKNKNTATLLQYALAGAEQAAGPNCRTELLHLYDFAFTGCRSCFQCKRLGGKSYGRCAVKDGITPLLERVSHADALVLGSPIYFGSVTGLMRCFLERLLFPFYVYAEKDPGLAPKKLRVGVVYTMNLTEQTMRDWGYPTHLELTESYLARLFGFPVERLHACNTYQFDDYSKYKCVKFSGTEKAKYRDEHFPGLCQEAEEMGKRLVGC